MKGGASHTGTQLGHTVMVVSGGQAGAGVTAPEKAEALWAAPPQGTAWDRCTHTQPPACPLLLSRITTHLHTHMESKAGPGTSLTLAVLDWKSFSFPDIVGLGDVNYRATAQVQTPVVLQLPHGETLDKLWELVSFHHCDKISEAVKERKGFSEAVKERNGFSGSLRSSVHGIYICHFRPVTAVCPGSGVWWEGFSPCDSWKMKRERKLL